MAISAQQLTIYLYSAHRAVIFAIAQLSCLIFCLQYRPAIITAAATANLSSRLTPLIVSATFIFDLKQLSFQTMHSERKTGVENRRQESIYDADFRSVCHRPYAFCSFC